MQSQFFSYLFTDRQACIQHQLDSLENLKLKKLLDGDTKFLEAPITDDEIKTTFLKMKRGTTPGPDGYTVDFFALNREIVGADLLKAIQSCFLTSQLYFPLNATVLTLAPKVTTSITMKDFRSICLL